MEIKDGYLILPKDYKAKKITATSFYGLLGGNKFKPRGDYLLGVLGLLKEPSDEFYMKRGAIAETILNKYLKEKGYETKIWDKYVIKFDNFPTHKEFGGMIDIAITNPFRCVVECKSKNIKDTDKIKQFPNLEQEYQALFYGYMSKCRKVKIFYVFFTDEQEQRIREDKPIDIENEKFEFYEKDLEFNENDLEEKLKQALAYKKDCIEKGKILLSDISDKALVLLGLKGETK